jgi:hypothetical protein
LSKKEQATASATANAGVLRCAQDDNLFASGLAAMLVEEQTTANATADPYGMTTKRTDKALA